MGLGASDVCVMVGVIGLESISGYVTSVSLALPVRRIKEDFVCWFLYIFEAMRLLRLFLEFFSFWLLLPLSYFLFKVEAGSK